MTRRNAITIAAVAVAAAAVLGWVLVMSFFDGYVIPSEANTPTLQPGDRVLTRPLGDRDVERGELVVYSLPGEPGPNQHIGRVAAVGGDAVSAEQGSLVIDGDVVDEPYLPESTFTDGLDVIEVPDGHVLVLGDNRAHAADSRSFGTLPVEQIEGLVATRWWPVNRIGGV